MSLTNREREQALTEVIDAHNAGGNQEFENASRLDAERAKTRAAIIQEEGLLFGEWKFCGDRSDWVTLEAKARQDSFPGVCVLLKPDYHSYYTLWEDFSQTLRFDDGTLTLRIPQSEVSQFVTDYGIKVDLDSLIQRRDALANQLNTVTKLVAEMQGLIPMSSHRQRAIRPPREF